MYNFEPRVLDGFAQGGYRQTAISWDKGLPYLWTRNLMWMILAEFKTAEPCGHLGMKM